MEQDSELQQIDNMFDLLREENNRRKRPAALGKLNRMAIKATALIEANGHGTKRFKRDYDAGVSSYVCPHCSLGAVILAVDGRGKSKMEGEALTSKCTVTI